jgi:glycosyltransferase involved in cell wall biosynthesis
MLDITVAIRVYNGATRLPSMLDRLRSQIQLELVSWEVLIVDNNSTDNTADIVRDCQSNWLPQCQLRYVFESQQGAAIARRRAIHEANGQIIAFLDDDNLPAPNWVAAAHTFAQTHPNAGAYGSRILPDYEVEPPQNFQRISHYLPTMERKNAFRYDSYKRGLPVGAGLVIRKQVWLDLVTDQIVQGPVGKGFSLKGEETEALSYIKQSSWEIWYNPEMTIVHKIPKWRLERDYLVNFFRVIGLSQHRFRMLRFQPWQRPFMFPLLLLNDLRKIALHFIQHSGTIKADIVTVCEMEFLLGRLVSPFHIWKNLYEKRKQAPLS